VVDVPKGDLFTARRGAGAQRNERPIAVSRNDDPSRALIGTGFPFKDPELLDAYQRQFAAVMSATAGIRRAGSAALDLCDIACGRFDAFWELMLAPWDIAAGLLIVREAGGIVTDLDGRHVEPAHTPVVAGSAAMHRWLLARLIENR
jgi:myo-inositol-1(or 4)-monophosphatase